MEVSLSKTLFIIRPSHQLQSTPFTLDFSRSFYEKKKVLSLLCVHILAVRMNHNDSLQSKLAL